MTVTSWYSYLQHSRRRPGWTGARGSGAGAFRRRASFEALEGRALLSTVTFNSSGETVKPSAGTFRIPVTLSSPPGGTPTVSNFAGINTTGGVATDAAGNVYVADVAGNKVRRVTPSGVVSTFVTGLLGPEGMAFGPNGDLYIAENFDGVDQVTPGGQVTDIANGSLFDDPRGLAIDAAGNVYVANYSNGTVVEVTPAGAVSTFASGFNHPVGLAFGASGNLYVANSGDNTVSEVTPAGVKSTFATEFNTPFGLAFDSAGNLYVTCSTESAIVSKVTPTGAVSTFVSGLLFPGYMGFDGAGNLYIDDNFEDGTQEVIRVNQTVSVPFTLGGTAATGVAYSGVTPSPLTFGIGQTTRAITGTLLSDPGPSQTLTFTLGTPTAGASLDFPSVNTLTIAEPAAVRFTTGGETVNASAGTFSIPVTVSGDPSAGITVSPFASGFNDPLGMAFDSAGNLFVADGADQTVDEVTPAGVVSTFASGFPSNGVFSSPTDVAFNSAGDLFVTSSDDNTVREVTLAGKVTTFASGFDDPVGLAFDRAGNLYVSNENNGKVSKVTPAGVVSTFATGLNAPNALAIDSAGDLFVTSGEVDVVDKITPAGVVSAFASIRLADGLAFDAAGNLYVADDQDDTVDVVTPAGVVGTLASGLNEPAGLAFDAAGNLYVADDGDGTVVKLSETVTVPFTLGGTAASGKDYSGVTASPLAFRIGQTTVNITGKLISDPGLDRTLTFTLGTPTGGAVLGSPSVNTLTIGELATVQFTTGSETVSQNTGTFSIPVTVSGTPTVSTFASGFNEPYGLAFDAAGNLYVANYGDGTVGEVTPAGVVSTFASGFDEPFGLTFDAAGNLYVTNVGDGTVREVTPAGKVTTFATGFNAPFGLAFDASGNLYVSNIGNGMVSEVTLAGKVSTFASGFKSPNGLAFDAAGNLYVVSNDSDTVSKVTPAGVITTFASGLNGPVGLAVDSTGNLYVTNLHGDTVSVLTPAGAVSTLAGFDGPTGLALHGSSLYVANLDNETISKVTDTVTVPFTLGGTAAAGVAFSGVTPSPLTFPIGQTTKDITGTLLSDPGPDRTLTFTLGTPTDGVILGNPSVNTLTITRQAVVQFSTGSEEVAAIAGAFSIPVTVVGIPEGTPTAFLYASGFKDPEGVAVDHAGDVYVADTSDDTLREVTAAGAVFQFAGFNDPVGLASSAAGDVYVADSGDNEVREITPAGAVSILVAGINDPTALAFDAAGDLFVASLASGTVDKVTPAGVVSTFASGFNKPSGLAVDAAGDLYVANLASGTVDKVTPAGKVSTFASGFDDPDGLAFDAAGGLLVANGGNNTVSQVTPAGVVSPYASGLDGPVGLAFDATGDLYVANEGNNTVSQVAEGFSVPFTLGGIGLVAAGGVTASPLTFRIGQTTQDITGTLGNTPGLSGILPLTLTLGTPTGGVVLGSPSVNTMFILVLPGILTTAPKPTPTRTPTSTPTPTSTAPPVSPVFIGEQPVFSHKGKHKKLVGFELPFSSALDAGSAQSTGHYRVTQGRGRKVKVLAVKSALYDPGDFSVTLSVDGLKAGKAAQVTITGLTGADGAAIPPITSGL